MDTMGVITFFNEFSQRFFGYNEAKIIGKNVIGTIVPEYETTGRNLKLLIEDIGRNPEFHINNVNENVCRNGERVWIAWTNKPIYNEDKEVTEILCIGNDITERKQMEKALQESEEQFRKIFEKSSLGMVMAGINLNFIRANEAFCNMLGYTEQELLLLTFKDITHPEHIAEDVIHVNDLISGKIPLYRTEKRYIRKDKGIVWGSSTVNILCDSNDRFLYFLTTVEDITQRKRSEEEKTRLESQLRQAQKTEAIGTLAGGIAHDFNNILTALMGYATLMQMKIDKSSPLKSYVEQILSASRKAADLTQSLLAFSRQQPVILVPLDINNTIKATKKLLKRLLTEDIELQTSLMQDDTIAMADKSQIDQILFNLVTNARDALPKGGTITIETNIAAIDKTFINGHEFVKPGRYVLISVSDTGIGMDEATIDKIFDPFFTTKEVGKGTGLGLATVYGIVKQHNGYITVDSKPNSGTIFHIYLPAVRMKVDDKQDKTTPIATGKEIILIAEDNKEVRYFMREALQQHGYIIIEAADGEDAVDKFKQHRDTDLIVVDSVMPKKNGMEVYKEIHGINPHIKVLFTSGYTKDVVLDKGIEDKEFDFVAKPLLLDRLLQKVREILDRK
jgi:PAS domain S-box-containing protein